ncbi:uncharacterized protein EDB91DRAFT_1099810 [Suillus paluster]|uniref:uncharacterized protein n=1 Tax=Suillus paluster TaxID=48578 RepID=UPI001B8632A6|nr:uncharacterized protein EDB91DRAFT_1099810 [Suillus paluster]KAG1753784.1 hypothetical protein EDB91DRAFT_1099810 [Suillus paluster]
MEARPRENTITDTSPPSALDAQTNFFQKRPAITHFAVLVVFLTPLAALPYLLSKRRISALSIRLDELSATTTALRKELKTSATENAIQKVELHRTSVSLEAARSEVVQLRRSFKHLRAERDAFDITTQNTLKQLREERKLTSERLALLPQLGISLADVAAFMYEVELYHGTTPSAIDGHGVERLRRLALKFCTAQSEGPR